MSLSRIGKLPVIIPAGVTITVDSGDVVVKGPKGELKQFITPAVEVRVEDGQVTVYPKDESKVARSQHGLMRALINNMVIGVTKGYEKRLEVNGVGFRVSSSNNELEMALGFSHPVKYKAPEGVTVTNEKMIIVVSGINKQQVGQVAGTAERPRLTVTISNLHVSAQLIDDVAGKTLAAATTVGTKAAGTMTEKSAAIGAEIAKKAKKIKISAVVFDRNGRQYAGRLKALADAARQEGLEF